MRFARLGDKNNETPCLVVETENGDFEYYDISSITDDINGEFFNSDKLEDVLQNYYDNNLQKYPFQKGITRIGSPIARPNAIICIGLNYAEHAAESGANIPKHPVVFMKMTNTISGPYDSVVIPRGSYKTDWEVELGIVIKEETSYLNSTLESMSKIAGYVLVNDLSERTFQLEKSGGQWSKGKSSAGFTPVGPYLVTPDEIDEQDLDLKTWINGEIRQNSNTSDLIFKISEIIYDLSQYMVLEPGDLILTGTPEGVALSGRFPYINDGDICEMEIKGLGKQKIEFVSHIDDM